ncbi:PucR family transcriptional regulator [Rhodococcus triatomae]
MSGPLSSESDARRQFDALLGDVVGRDDQLTALAAAADEQIVESVPELDTAELRRALAACTRSLARAMLPGLSSGTTPTTLPDAVYEFVEVLVDNDLDLPVLLRTCRAGQNATVRGLMDALERRTTDVPPQLLLHVASFTADWAGSTAETLSATFGRGDGGGGFAARRERAVRTVLGGGPLDAAQIESRLGYRLGGVHHGFVVWRGDGDRDLVALARALAGADVPVLAVEAAGGTVWGWIGCGSPDHGGCLARVDLDGTGSMVALGPPLPGIDGFRSSHRQAVAAQSVAIRAGMRERVVDFRDVEIEYLCSRDVPSMTDFVARELGALGDDPKLVDTLGAYLTSGCSVEAAARRLRVHRNTVRYRLEHVEQALGHPVEHRRLELELAIRCARTFDVPTSR